MVVGQRCRSNGYGLPPHKWHFRNRKTGVQSLIFARKGWSMDRAVFTSPLP